MDLKQLTAMITVAEVGSVTRAAKLLHIVQPAVTRQVRTLEEELGVDLFERTRQGMVLTPAGEVLLARARRALQELERARSELAPEPGKAVGMVSIGVLESLVDLVAVPLAERVAAKHPGVKLHILAGFSGYLQEWLDDGVVDVAMLYNLADTPSMTVVPLLSERLWAVAPPGAGLSPDSPVSWRDLMAQSLILPIPGHGLRTLIEKARASVPGSPAVAVETNSMSVQKELVRAGRGWTVLPASGVVREVQSGSLSGAPLAEPSSARSVVIGLPRASRVPPAVEVIAAELVRVVRQLVSSGEWPSAVLDDV